jgi:hypothetical protein
MKPTVPVDGGESIVKTSVVCAPTKANAVLGAGRLRPAATTALGAPNVEAADRLDVRVLRSSAVRVLFRLIGEPSVTALPQRGVMQIIATTRRDRAVGSA